MNNAKMWLVVSPAVGVPIFLSAVAVGSFAVHVAVLSNTSWVADFLSGQELGTGSKVSAILMDGDTNVAKASYVHDTEIGRKVTLVMPDGTTARAILLPDDELALANANIVAPSN
ncbi:MAG: light-harvesting protein [Paracoccaceae bacterium]